jgi:hypothetical protein
MMVHYKGDKEERMHFFFCKDDIKWFVKDIRRRWIKSKLDVPNIWPVKIRTNLSKKAILNLDNTSFQLPKRAIISPRRLFGMEELLFDLSLYPTPTSPDNHLKTKLDKNIRRTTRMYSQQNTLTTARPF